MLRALLQVTGRRPQKPQIGVLLTEARILGGIDPLTFASARRLRIIDELEKHYDIERIDAHGSPKAPPFGMLIIPQISSLLAKSLENVDCLGDAILAMRDRPSSEVPFALDNLTFVLNCIDTLLGDRRYLELRGRRPLLPPRSAAEAQMADALRVVERRAADRSAALREEFKKRQAAHVRAAEDQLKAKPDDRVKVQQALQAAMRALEKKLQVRQAELERNRDRKLAEVRYQLRKTLKLHSTR